MVHQRHPAPMQPLRYILPGWGLSDDLCRAKAAEAAAFVAEDVALAGARGAAPGAGEPAASPGKGAGGGGGVPRRWSLLGPRGGGGRDNPLGFGGLP